MPGFDTYYAADTIAFALASIEDPMTHSTEGLDDGCFFCGAWSQSYYNKETHDFEHFADDHKKSCLWVRARQAYGLRLGRHQVKVLNV